MRLQSDKAEGLASQLKFPPIRIVNILPIRRLPKSFSLDLEDEKDDTIITIYRSREEFLETVVLKAFRPSESTGSRFVVWRRAPPA